MGITDAAAFDYHEREIVAMRARHGIPTGNFDLKHLRAIHRHLFQDVYDWAGDVRTVEISKGGSQFQFRQYIETGMADVHRRLAGSDFMRGLDRPAFAAKVAAIIGDVNYVHPFREGNGRTQLQYLKQLSVKAGHPLDLTKIDAVKWIDASIQANQTSYDLMADVIESALRQS
ncbi:Fic/DOC family protein [Neorhizobium lilium]|uniref:Fic/DOC family protein n=1 Tax=Neorhizobium lilium TaxID=2503024 RepID=UPI001FE1801B|nr:Fic family protein [Neorhizobium lilium]